MPPIALKSKIQLTAAGCLLIIAFLSTVFCLPEFICLLIPSLIDVYIIFILFLAAVQSDKKKQSWKKDWHLDVMPTRFVSLILFSFMVTTVVLSFAGIYAHHFSEFKDALNTKFDAVYVSFITVATLGYSHFEPISQHMQTVAMFEFFTSITLILGALSLLISRFQF